MNPLNYATLEASKRLQAAVIVLETEAVWWERHENHWILRPLLLCGELMVLDDKCVPAPSMAEVWRELPEGSDTYKKDMGMSAHFWNGEVCSKSFFSTNPTDALIDLLIWVRGQKGGD